MWRVCSDGWVLPKESWAVAVNVAAAGAVVVVESQTAALARLVVDATAQGLLLEVEGFGEVADRDHHVRRSRSWREVKEDEGSFDKECRCSMGVRGD